MSDKKLESLKKAIDESKYTVAICGSGILEECGKSAIKSPGRAYDIEQKYGMSPEYIFTDSYFSTRTTRFYEFYRNEMLVETEPPKTAYCLAAMERAGKLNCVITANICEFPQRAGCTNVLNLHGSIYHNICPRCKKEYSYEYVRDAAKVPLCEKCGTAIRPEISLFGDMLDSEMIYRATEEVEKADLLLILGTTLDSDVFHEYFRYFNGDTMAVIHKEEHIKDKNATLVIYDTPGNALSEIGFF